MAGTQQLHHVGNVHLNRAAAARLLASGQQLAELAGLVGALLVAQCLQPDQQIDLTLGVADVHVAEVALVDQFEVFAALLGGADIRRNRGAGRPVDRQPLEHRVALRKVAVERADELALGSQRQIPDETHQHQGCVVAQQQFLPQGRGEFLGQLRLAELGGDRPHPVGDEHVAEGARIGLQPAPEQIDLTPVGLHRLRAGQLLDLGRGLSERLGRRKIAGQIIVACRGHGRLLSE